METLVILAAVAATLLACILVATLSKGPRQPPLRLPREEEWADNADAVSKALTPARASPIDRAAPVLDAHVIDTRPIEGPIIEGEVVDGRARDAPGARPGVVPGAVPGAGDTRRFDAEELDSRMLDQLLDQHDRALKQALERDAPPPSAPKDGSAR